MCTDGGQMPFLFLLSWIGSYWEKVIGDLSPACDSHLGHQKDLFRKANPFPQIHHCGDHDILSKFEKNRSQ